MRTAVVGIYIFYSHKCRNALNFDWNIKTNSNNKKGTVFTTI